MPMKRSGRKVWGDLRHEKGQMMSCVTAVVAAVLVLSPFLGAEGASFALEQQVASRLHRHHQDPHHFQSGGSGGANGNVMNLNMFRSNVPSGGRETVEQEEEELFETGVLDDGDSDDIQIAAASDPVPIVVEHHEARRRPEAVERLLEKMESVKQEEDAEERGSDEEDQEEEESATVRQFKSMHHLHQHQRQHEEAKDSMTESSRTRAQSGRALFTQNSDRKKASELCGTSASLECGKRILSLIEGEQMTELSVHMKCDLRDDFLKCIDTNKRGCLEEASKSVFPELPPKDVIKSEQSKLWKILWTAGGCVLAD